MVLRAINAIVVAAALVGAAGFQSQTTPSITSLLDRYAQGDFNAADWSRLDTAAWGAFAAALETAAPVWVQQGPASDSLRRRLIANSFALEVANVALDTPSRLVARRILGWACANVRRAPANDDARVWWTASVTALPSRSVRALIATSNPASASFNAAALPIPRLAPVTRTTGAWLMAGSVPSAS